MIMLNSGFCFNFTGTEWYTLKSEGPIIITQCIHWWSWSVSFKSTVSFKDHIKIKLNAAANDSLLVVAIKFSMNSQQQMPLKFSHSSSDGWATVWISGYCFVWVWFDTLLDTMFFCKNQVCNVVLLWVLGENFTVRSPVSQLQAQPQDIHKLTTSVLNKKPIKNHCLITKLKFDKMSCLEHLPLLPCKVTVCHAL